MTKWWIPVVAVLHSFTATAESAIDTEKTFLCSAVKVMDCAASGSCTAGTADIVNLPTFYEVSLQRKLIEGKRPDGTLAQSTVLHHSRTNGSLLIQGHNERRAWSASINLSNGKLVATVAMEDEAFVLFGACIQPNLQ